MATKQKDVNSNRSRKKANLNKQKINKKEEPILMSRCNRRAIRRLAEANAYTTNDSSHHRAGAMKYW